MESSATSTDLSPDRSSERRKKLIVVIGTTGAGKSKLAVEVATAIGRWNNPTGCDSGDEHDSHGGSTVPDSSGDAATLMDVTAPTESGVCATMSDTRRNEHLPPWFPRGAEVVNADAIQLYKGLDIATNKVTDPECEGVAHHLIGVLDSTVTGFTVAQYTRMAIDVIDDIIARGNIPILVGGTHYYIEAVVWNALLDVGDNSTPLPRANREDSIPPTEGGSPYERLQRVDPDMASVIHPNDARKIARSLEVYDTTGKRHSDIIRTKTSVQRYDCCFLWPRMDDMEVLDRKLDSRVDDMVQRGLVDEMNGMYEAAFLSNCTTKATGDEASTTTTTSSPSLPSSASSMPSQSSSSSTSSTATTVSTEKETTHPTSSDPPVRPTFDDGLFQAIGFKEFIEYLDAVADYKASGEGVKEPNAECNRDDELEALFTRCVDRHKQRTRRYARRQVQWIRKRLIPRTTVNTFNLSGPSPNWEEEVLQPAEKCVRTFLCAQGSLLSSETPPSTTSQLGCGDVLKASRRVFVCDHCEGRKLRGESEWNAHLKSRAHRKKKKRRHP
eukprot:TRINITY_DN2973_c0_g1_i2.p1 TRINITY_DN2973_c0_g1~~TRINITY_DN2973_c0_g1_i2.p1  ORF type:complete len:555 (+),score=88.00 TRINITY_DN2973_c0_g1_i2:128-1792(+)